MVVNLGSELPKEVEGFAQVMKMHNKGITARDLIQTSVDMSGEGGSPKNPGFEQKEVDLQIRNIDQRTNENWSAHESAN